MKNVFKAFIGILLIMLSGCQSDDDSEAYEQGTNEHTNLWMYQQMKKYYYWNKNMPGKGDLSVSPKEYFAGLLYTEDRFSYAINPNDSGTYPKSVRNSFGFDLAFTEHEGQVLGVILYAMSDSPAMYAGLHRGQYITAINGVPVTHANYQSIYKTLSQSTDAVLQITEYSEETGFTAPQDITIASGIILLQPVYHTILQQQGHKTGYINVPHFDIGLSQSLLNAFIQFKQQDVDEVVVDLRYNGGGDVSSATALCTLLAPNIQPDDLFIRFQGNKNGGLVEQTFKQSLEMNEQQVSFEALRNAHPQLQRVYILCGTHTASASEIIINNLEPFMEVITIGEKTVGKDTATFPIEDETETANQAHWVLYPVIYKLSNANGEGGYADGILPSVPEDELRDFKIFPLGNSNEVLLHHALSLISGDGRSGSNKKVKRLQNTQMPDSDFIIVNALR